MHLAYTDFKMSRSFGCSLSITVMIIFTTHAQEKARVLAALNYCVSGKYAPASVYCLNSGCAGISFTDVTVIALIDADFNFNVFHITCQTVSFFHKLFENLLIIPIHKIDHKEKETKRKTKRKTDRLMTYLLILKFGYVFSLF